MSQKFGLSARGRQMLAALRVPQTDGGLAALGLHGPDLQALQAAGLIEPQDDTLPPAEYQDIFAGWKSQKGMLIDAVRTGAFDRAIRTLVRPGDRVIDVGTGSGILALFAARAGAGQVQALELTAMADWAARLAAANGLTQVQVIRGDAARHQAGGPVDLVMGEFAGMWLLEEWRHYAAFVALRDRWLKPGGQVLPRAAELFLSAVDSPRLHRERGWGFFDQPVHGFDFSDVLMQGAYRPARYILSADWARLVATRPVARFDFRSGTERDYLFQTEVRFPYDAGGLFHGVIGHFTLDLAPGLTLSTSAGAAETHWHQSYFPMPERQVPPGAALRLAVRTFLTPGAEALHLGLRAALPDEPMEAQAEHVFALE